MTASRPLPPSTICVVDSDCIIGLKRIVKLDDQWDYFQVLTELVEGGIWPSPGRSCMRCAVCDTPTRPELGSPATETAAATRSPPTMHWPR